MRKFALGLLCAACMVSTNQERLSLSEIQNTIVKRDILLSINGVEYKGVAAVPAAPEYRIKAKWFNAAEVVTVSNCHVDEQFQKSRIKDRLELEFNYKPAPGLEDRDSCIIEIAALDKDGQHSFGTIAINHGEDLDFNSICGGSGAASKGIAICQSKAGLIQQVNFNEPTLVDAVADCPELAQIDNNRRVYEYALGLGTCSYQFLSVKSGKWGRLTTVGYNAFMIRTDPPIRHIIDKNPADILKGSK